MYLFTLQNILCAEEANNTREYSPLQEFTLNWIEFSPSYALEKRKLAKCKVRQETTSANQEKQHEIDCLRMCSVHTEDSTLYIHVRDRDRPCAPQKQQHITKSTLMFYRNASAGRLLFSALVLQLFNKALASFLFCHYPCLCC